MHSDFIVKTAGDLTPTTWLPGVISVKRVESLTRADAIQGWSSYDPDYSLVNMGSLVEPQAILTLLDIQTVSYSGFVVIESAWLVGPGGGTVDRLSSSYAGII